MILVITGALNVTLWSIREQDRVTESIIEKTNTNLNRLNEDLSISDVKVTNNRMNLTVTNNGGAASYIKTLYVVNETSKQQYKYDIDTAVDGRTSVSNIGQASPSFVIKNNTNYTVKLVSQSGVTTSTNISPTSGVGLTMSLTIIPPTVVPGQNVTLLFAVTNNVTGSFIPTKVTPTLSKSMSCPVPACEFTSFSTYPAPQDTYLAKGSTVFFKWVFKADGADGAIMTFNASLLGAKQGNYAIEKARLQTIKSAEASEIFVGSTLLAKPEVFIIAPGPFGEAGNNVDKGYWGIVLANPVDIKLNITQMSINLFSSEPSANHKPLTTGCDITGITPSTGWTCPHDGTMRWSNPGSPITINQYETYTFLAKVKPGSLNSHEPALLISVTAFSNLGQFSKQGYATNMYNTGAGGSAAAPIANLYITDTTVNTDAVKDSPTNHILGNMKMNSAQTRQINVTVADFETTNDAASKILSGGVLIINVPKNFSDITIPNPLPPGFSSVEVLPRFADGTTQIRATLGEDIGDVNGLAEGKVFYFSTRAPTVTISRTYVMHTFLDAFANTNPQFEVSAFGSFGILVCTSGC